MSKQLNVSRFFRPTVDNTVANIVDEASLAESPKANIVDANCINENNVEYNVPEATKPNQPGKNYSFKMSEFGRYPKIERRAVGLMTISGYITKKTLMLPSVLHVSRQ